MFNLELILYKAKAEGSLDELRGILKTGISAEKLKKFMIDSKKVAF